MKIRTLVLVICLVSASYGQGMETVHHDKLDGYDPNDHINHTAVSIIAGTGLSGGGTIAADRTFNVNIGTDVQAEITAGTTSQFWRGDKSWQTFLGETSITAYRGDRGKTAYDHIHNLTTDINHDALLNFVDAEHYNWTSETHALHTTNKGRFDGGVGVGADPTELGLCLANAKIYKHNTWLYLSGDGTTNEGLDIAIPDTAGNDFFYGYGGTEHHKFGATSQVEISDDGKITAVTHNDVTISKAIDQVKISANAAADSWETEGVCGIQSQADGFILYGGTQVSILTVTGGDWTLDQSVASGAAPTFNNLKIEGGIPILVFKDNTDTGDSARGFQEWRDLNNVRLGYFGNSSYTHDDLVWTNESSGGHLLLYTTGTGKVGINTANPSATLDVAGALGCGEVTVADGGSINLQEALTFLGATTENLIEMPDNLAVALAIKEAGNSYLTFVTTNAGEKIAFDTNTLVVDATNNRVGIRTASPAYPLHIFSDASNLISEVDGFYLDYYADASAVGGTKIAGYFNCKPTGTMGTITAFYGLAGYCFPTDGGFDNNAQTTTLIGLDFKVNLGNDFTGKNRGNSLTTKGLYITSYGGSAGYAVGTGTGDDLDVEMINYGGQIVAYLDGTHATPNTGYNYGLHIETNDSLDAEPAAAINSYALYLVSMANTNLNGGESWGIYSASDVVNAIHGKLRIGSVVAPTVALDVTGAALISTTLDVTGVATLGDSSQMATSAAPTADADLANKKYVDDTAAAHASATGSYTGDGTTSKGITGVGFSPKYVRVFQQETTDGLNVEIFSTTPEIMDDNANGGCVWLASGLTRFVDNAIISLGADGFTVDDDGVDGHPNTDGVVYNYVCVR